MRIHKRHLRGTWAAAAAASALLIAGCGESGNVDQATDQPTTQSLVKVELGSTTRSLAILPVLHALQAGYFEDEGLDVNFQPPNAKSADVALSTTSGASDLAVVGSTATVVAANTGRGVVGVAAVAQSPTNVVAITNKALQKLRDKGLSVTPDSPLVDRLKALGELTLGVPPQGSSGQVVMRYTLQENGLDPDEVLKNTRNLADGAALATAAREGQIDGFLWSPPAALLPAVQGFGVTWINWAEGVPATDGVNFTDVVTSQDFIDENPEVVKKFMNALAKAAEDIKQTPDDVAATVKTEWFADTEQELFDLSFEAVLPSFQQGIVPDSEAFSTLLDLVNAGTQEPMDLSYEDVYNPEFAEQAAG